MLLREKMFLLYHEIERRKLEIENNSLCDNQFITVSMKNFEKERICMKVYHYRSIESALLEIECGTFRFANQKELNDPMEGYVHLYWEGDKAAWEGLFKNYICSLYKCLDDGVKGVREEYLLEDVVINDLHHVANDAMYPLFQELSDAFIQDDSVQKCIEILMTVLKNRTGLNTLTLWLTLVSLTAYNICAEKINERFQKEVLEIIKDWDYKYFQDLADVFLENPSLMDLMNEIRDSWELDRIKSYFQKKKTQFELLDYIRETFSHLYVNQLKDIIYPEGFVVCFSVENDNSVMWGNYADKHRGVCLVYELEINSETGKVELEAAASGRKIDAEAGIMSYVNRPVQRNFFETLGKDGSGQVNSWLENSKFLKTSQTKKMQKQYQEDFKKKYFTKMEEWEYEEEFRLLVDGLAINFEEERFFKYKDNALIGVCFGLETSNKDKARILEALRKIGKDLNDFCFFQAEYNETERCIKIRENTNMELLFRNKANFNRS